MILQSYVHTTGDETGSQINKAISFQQSAVSRQFNQVDAVEIVLKLLTISIRFNKMGTIYNVFINKRHEIDKIAP
jgi:hypothetical protein